MYMLLNLQFIVLTVQIKKCVKNKCQCDTNACFRNNNKVHFLTKEHQIIVNLFKFVKLKLTSSVLLPNYSCIFHVFACFAYVTLKRCVDFYVPLNGKIKFYLSFTSIF